MKGLSIEVKYVDSTIKKEDANSMNEIGSFSKTIKDFEKDLKFEYNLQYD